MRPRPTGLRCVAGLATAALGVLLLEALVRFAAPAYDPSGHVAFTQLADGTIIGPPNTTSRQIKNTGDYDVEVRFNEFGFRDTKALRSSTSNSIFVVGDSFAFGWGVDETERFSDLLQERLGRPVFNIGVPSTDVDGYLRLVRYAEAHGATIGTLVVSVCMENDLGIYGVPDDPQDETTGAEQLDAIKGYLTEHSATYLLFTSALHRSHRLEDAAIRLGLVAPVFGAIVEWEPSDAAIESTVRRVRTLTAGRHAIVLIVPSRGLWVGSPDHRRRIATAHESFVRALRREGLDVVDVRDRFEASGDPLSFHFAKDGHWNSRGHRAAADALAERF